MTKQTFKQSLTEAKARFIAFTKDKEAVKATVVVVSSALVGSLVLKSIDDSKKIKTLKEDLIDESQAQFGRGMATGTYNTLRRGVQGDMMSSKDANSILHTSITAVHVANKDYEEVTKSYDKTIETLAKED